MASHTGLVTDRLRDEIHSDESMEAFGSKLDIPLPRSNQKKQLKRQMRTYAKSVKVILNILWICLEDASYEILQEHEKLLVQISVYLSTDLSLGMREKETLFVE